MFTFMQPDFNFMHPDALADIPVSLQVLPVWRAGSLC